jgi:RNA polymerase sigma-70 factor, ECF subfamily
VLTDIPCRPPSEIAALTSRLVRGDEAAYRLFYDRYYSRLLRYLLVLTGGQQEAACEALQMTLLRVVRHIKTFESEDVFWSWLTVLGRSAVVDEARKRKRYTALLDRFFSRNQLDAVPADSGEADTRLLEMLEKNLVLLPSDDRELIDRRYFNGQPVKEIAEHLRVTEKAIDSRLVRARRKLKDFILAQLKNEKAI